MIVCEDDGAAGQWMPIRVRWTILGALLALTAAAGQTKLEPRPGEICFLCNERIAATDLVYQVEGQRMPVHRVACDDTYLAEPQRWLVRLKARGAFLGAVPDRRALSPVWFVAGVYLLAGLVFAGASAHRALHTGHRPATWFFAGLALNAPAYLYLLTRPPGTLSGAAPPGLRKMAATSEPQPCKHCGVTNHPAATLCLGCGARLEPRVVSEASRC